MGSDFRALLSTLQTSLKKKKKGFKKKFCLCGRILLTTPTVVTVSPDVRAKPARCPPWTYTRGHADDASMKLNNQIKFRLFQEKKGRTRSSRGNRNV